MELVVPKVWVHLEAEVAGRRESSSSWERSADSAVGPALQGSRIIEGNQDEMREIRTKVTVR